MLVLWRKKNESIVINDEITIVVVEIRGDKVRLGIECPKGFSVHRKEVFDALRRNEQSYSTPEPALEPASFAPEPPPASCPAEITLMGRHVDFVDRLRDAIRAKSGLRGYLERFLGKNMHFRLYCNGTREQVGLG